MQGKHPGVFLPSRSSEPPHTHSLSTTLSKARYAAVTSCFAWAESCPGFLLFVQTKPASFRGENALEDAVLGETSATVVALTGFRT